MRDYTAKRARYLRDPLPLRLGGLAANLARVNSFATIGTNDQLVHGLLDESKHFIEWTAAEAALDIAAELVELQVQLALWQYQWTRVWADPAQRTQVAEQAQWWSDRVLDWSGLLNEN